MASLISKIQNKLRQRAACYLFCLALPYLLSGCGNQPHEHLVAEGSSSSGIRLAVWDFDNNSMAGGELDYLRKALSEMLITNLSQTSDIRLVERVSLQEVLEEQHLSSSELTSEDERIKLGKIAGANLMAFGSYMAMGSKIRVDVRVVDVESSLVKFSEDAVCSPQDVAIKVQTIAAHLAKKLGGNAFSNKDNATDMKLWKHYEEGISLMDKKLYDPAITIFKDILVINPDFKAAEKQIKLALELQARK